MHFILIILSLLPGLFLSLCSIILLKAFLSFLQDSSLEQHMEIHCPAALDPSRVCLEEELSLVKAREVLTLSG